MGGEHGSLGLLRFRVILGDCSEPALPLLPAGSNKAGSQVQDHLNQVDLGGGDGDPKYCYSTLGSRQGQMKSSI